jgi:hypothetical protein
LYLIDVFDLQRQVSGILTIYMTRATFTELVAYIKMTLNEHVVGGLIVKSKGRYQT